MRNGDSGLSRSDSAQVVGRLAPSPTGRMHLGNIYACLAAWLGVRSSGASGVLRLRIEDIDGPRVVEDADRWIMDDLDWLGLDWDGPVVYQSRRAADYDQALNVLQEQHLADGGPLVYPCFCSRADIRAASAPNEGDGFLVYPGTCREMWSRNGWAGATGTACVSRFLPILLLLLLSADLTTWYSGSGPSTCHGTWVTWLSGGRMGWSPISSPSRSMTWPLG